MYFTPLQQFKFIIKTHRECHLLKSCLVPLLSDYKTEQIITICDSNNRICNSLILGLIIRIRSVTNCTADSPWELTVA